MKPSEDNAEERSMKGHDSDFGSALEKQPEPAEFAPPGHARHVWLKMDLYVLPIIVMFYFLSFLDRTNIGNARVAGLQQQLHMTDKQYSIALTVTFVPYMLIEFPFNLVLKKIGPNIMLPAAVIAWGIVTTLQGCVTTYRGLIATRFFLGLSEGGLIPGICLYLASFYPRQRLQLRLSLVISASSLAGAFSGLLAASISNMEGVGGKHGWAWIFIIEGLFTVIFGVVSFFILPRTPSDTPFLTKQDQVYIAEVLWADGTVAKNEADDEFSWSQVRRAFTQIHVLLMAIAGFTSGAMLYAMAYFLPTIVSALGYQGNRAQLMSVPPYAVSFVLSNVSSYLSDRYTCRGLTIAFFSILSATGYAIFLGSLHPHARYGAIFCVLPGIYCSMSPLAAWAANNSAPHIRRATALCVLLSTTNTGGILSTWLFGALSPAPAYREASITVLVISIVLLTMALYNIAHLRRGNKMKLEMRETNGQLVEDPGAGDDSIWYDYKL